MAERKEMADKSRLRTAFRSLFDLAFILLVLTVAKAAIAEPYYIPSGSMEPTLAIGDELLAAKYAYGYSAASLPLSFVLPDSGRIMGALPQRGDVVVFRWPGDHAQIWIKRVIGLPGDRIALHAGRVWINGEPVEIAPAGSGQAESEGGAFVPAQRFNETLPGGRAHAIFKLVAHGAYDEMAELVVPRDRLFVMGDNRDNSADSRVALSDGGVGLLPVADLVGRAEVILGSWDLGMKAKPISAWPSGIRFSRFFTAIR